LADRHRIGPALPGATPQAARRGSGDTVRSRSLTGKRARQLRTAWTEAWDGEDSPGTLPMPLQGLLVADALSRIQTYETPERIGTPVGQIVGQMNEVRPVAAVMDELTRGFERTVARLDHIASEKGDPA
jgi:NAD(P)H-dependent flavin oxidoreductase YrpB (nitropropane dioxygenase family)